MKYLTHKLFKTKILLDESFQVETIRSDIKVVIGDNQHNEDFSSELPSILTQAFVISVQ